MRIKDNSPDTINFSPREIIDLSNNPELESIPDDIVKSIKNEADVISNMLTLMQDMINDLSSKQQTISNISRMYTNLMNRMDKIELRISNLERVPFRKNPESIKKEAE